MNFRGRHVRRGAMLGFTLVEAMVTIAVLIVLSMVAVPGMMDLIRDAQLSTQTDLLVNALNTARIEAVKRRANITACPAADPNTANACVADASLWSKGVMVSDGATILLRAPFSPGLVVATAANSVVFSGTLGSSPAAASFTLCASGRKQQQVDVSASGHVSKKINSATICN